MKVVDTSASAISPFAVAPAAPARKAASQAGFQFGDLLDILNPLQHIPIISTLYRASSGDQIKTFPKIAGDLLFGGMAGFLGSVADTIFERVTGRNVGDTMLAWIEGEASPGPRVLASANSAPPTPIAASPAPLDAIVIPDQDIAFHAASTYRSMILVAGIAAASALH